MGGEKTPTMTGVNPLIECVPNFSEGRDPSIIETLTRTVQEVPGVVLLDQHSDPDHNRTVLTFIGGAHAVGEAAFRLVQTAARVIDLRRHEGGHPRIGATDVVPFIPLQGALLVECVRLAREVGQRVGQELEIPVFLYEYAARTPQRMSLAAIRKGGLAGLEARLTQDPEWYPDFGPNRLHLSAGATVVGARKPLVAYNINLNSQDVSVAERIARKTRASSGGLPALKAIGLALPRQGLVQVSMNLTNYELTSPAMAFDSVQRAACAEKVDVVCSEFVGLVPQAAVGPDSQSTLKLEGALDRQILESRIQTVLGANRSPLESSAPQCEAGTSSLLSLSVRGLLDQIAVGGSVIGGGATAALIAGLAASIGLMVCNKVKSSTALARSDTGSPSSGPQGHVSPAFSIEVAVIHDRLLALRERLVSLIELDVEAYESVLHARRFAKRSTELGHLVDNSLEMATEVPLQLLTLAAQLEQSFLALISLAKPTLAADLQAAIAMAKTTRSISAINAEINANSVTNQMIKHGLQEKIRQVQESLVLT